MMNITAYEILFNPIRPGTAQFPISVSELGLSILYMNYNKLITIDHQHFLLNGNEYIRTSSFWRKIE